MVRVDFSADDVARISFCPRPAPLAETGLALYQLRITLARDTPPGTAHAGSGDRRAPGARPRDRPPAWHRQWLDRMIASFPASARPLLELIPRQLPTPEFLDPLITDLDEALEFVRTVPCDVVRADLARCWRAHAKPGTRPPLWMRNLADGDRESREVVVRALRDLYTTCVQPFWDMVTETCQADLARRMPVLATGGYADLFAGVHPRLAWKDHGLEREGGTGRYALNGSGVRLAPSAFWTGQPLFCFRRPDLGGNALIYAATPAAGD